MILTVLANSTIVTERFATLRKGLSGVDVINDGAAPSEPVEGTCEWIMKNETCQSWLNKDIGMLWVSVRAHQAVQLPANLQQETC